MTELKITDIVGRHLQPGNVIALNTLDLCGYVFDGIWTIVTVCYESGRWSLELTRYSYPSQKRLVSGYWFENTCFAYSNLIFKLSEGPRL